MDATARKWFFCYAIITATMAGCGQNAVNAVTSSDCAAQAQETSFLVKWKNQVPSEYLGQRLHPQSLTTVFRNTEEATLSRDVLQKHQGEYEIAEHEFMIQSIALESNISPSTTGATVPPAVWAPQDIQVQQAWQLLGEKGDGVVVAVVDSGVDPNHPLLQNEIWNNPGETGLDANGKDKATNGIDDDQDGFVDDAYGWNFNAGTPNIYDDNSHGTHVSGIISGQTQASTGFMGVAPNAKIMALKFIDSTGAGSVTDAISAIDYAAAHGAKVINASWGGATCSSILEQDIQTAGQSGIVFVNAAGNGNAEGVGVDISQAPEWPAVYQLPGKITVASYNLQQVISSFSNFGLLVDLAGPGENILSTVPPQTGQAEGQMAGKSGTSMATPYVAGVAALLFSARPSASAEQITAAINNSVVRGKFGVRTGGKLNALTAAQYLLSH